MSWINDVKYELNKLDVSKKSLRKFGLTIGFLLIVVALVFYFFTIYSLLNVILLVIGTILILLGTAIPLKLLFVYKIWMGIAFVLGWFVSRFLLSVLFVFILTPIGIIAKLVNKKFLNLSFKSNNKSYWIESNKIYKNNYEKMY